MGIEPTRPAWKAGILTIELHPHLFNGEYIIKYLYDCQVKFDILSAYKARLISLLFLIFHGLRLRQKPQGQF